MKKTKEFTLTAMFLALMILLAVTPLGFIPLGPINATTMHIPVIIASIVLGPKIGAGLGGIFGLISLIRATAMPTVLSFVFSPFIPVLGTSQGSWKSLLIVFIPRILIGVVPYFVFIGLKKIMKNHQQSVSLFLAGLAGSLVNTILVMNMIYFLFSESYADVIGKSSSAVYGAIIAVIATSGIPEAIIAGLATAGVCSVLLRLTNKIPR